MPLDNTALIAALEQARAALDEIEMAATQKRKEKAATPPPAVEVEIEPKDQMEEE